MPCTVASTRSANGAGQTAGRQGQGGALASPQATGGPTATLRGALDLLEPGTSASDRDLVAGALQLLESRSPTGADILRRYLQKGKGIKVISDAEMNRHGATTIGYFTGRKILLQRDWLQKSPAEAAKLLAHEASHGIGRNEAGAEALTAIVGRELGVSRNGL